jgi:hypothetical protein
VVAIVSSEAIEITNRIRFLNVYLNYVVIGRGCLPATFGCQNFNGLLKARFEVSFMANIPLMGQHWSFAIEPRDLGCTNGSNDFSEAPTSAFHL